MCLLALPTASWPALCGRIRAAVKDRFRQEPRRWGWELRGHGDQPFDGGWVESPGTPQQRCLVVRSGYWQTPAIRVRPFHFYRCDCTSKAEEGGLWSAVFFDADGKEVVANVYDSLDGSADWQPQTFCIRGHAVARHVRLRLHAGDQPLWVKAAGLQEVDSATVAEWADGIAAQQSRPVLHPAGETLHAAGENDEDPAAGRQAAHRDARRQHLQRHGELPLRGAAEAGLSAGADRGRRVRARRRRLPVLQGREPGARLRAPLQARVGGHRRHQPRLRSWKPSAA